MLSRSHSECVCISLCIEVTVTMRCWWIPMMSHFLAIVFTHISNAFNDCNLLLSSVDGNKCHLGEERCRAIRHLKRYSRPSKECHHHFLLLSTFLARYIIHWIFLLALSNEATQKRTTIVKGRRAKRFVHNNQRWQSEEWETQTIMMLLWCSYENFTWACGLFEVSLIFLFSSENKYWTGRDL